MEIDTYNIFGLAILMIGGGIISWQGIQIFQGKRRARIKSFERSFIESMSEKNQLQLQKILGVLRILFGLFLIGLGIYFLVTILLK